MEDVASKQVAEGLMQAELRMEAYECRTVSFVKADLALEVPHIETDISFHPL